MYLVFIKTLFSTFLQMYTSCEADVWSVFAPKLLINMNGDVEKPIVTKLDVLWFLISKCVYSLGIYMQSQLMPPRDLKIHSSPLVVFGDNMLIMLGLILTFFAISSDMYHRTKLINIVKQFTTFDKKVIEITIF